MSLVGAASSAAIGLLAKKLLGAKDFLPKGLPGAGGVLAAVAAHIAAKPQRDAMKKAQELADKLTSPVSSEELAATKTKAEVEAEGKVREAEMKLARRSPEDMPTGAKVTAHQGVFKEGVQLTSEAIAEAAEALRKQKAEEQAQGAALGLQIAGVTGKEIEDLIGLLGGMEPLGTPRDPEQIAALGEEGVEERVGKFFDQG